MENSSYSAPPTRPPIVSFRGEHAFLSNFFPTPGLVVFGKSFPTAEHAYQCSKTLDPKAQERIRTAASPGLAKRLGGMVVLRPDWELVRIAKMTEVVRAKFQDPLLRRHLLATGDAELLEGNYWGDTFWGISFAKSGISGVVGENHLGKILMAVRTGCKIG